MPEVVEAEAMAIRNLDALPGCRLGMVFDPHVRHARCFAFQPGGGEDEIEIGDHPDAERATRHAPIST